MTPEQIKAISEDLGMRQADTNLLLYFIPEFIAMAPDQVKGYEFPTHADRERVMNLLYRFLKPAELKPLFRFERIGLASLKVKRIRQVTEHEDYDLGPEQDGLFEALPVMFNDTALMSFVQEGDFLGARMRISTAYDYLRPDQRNELLAVVSQAIDSLHPKSSFKSTNTKNVAERALGLVKED